jgi:putative acetyltransferase
MLKIVHTDSSNTDFASLVKLLDADLAKRDGDEHAFYAQFNKTAHIKHVVVAYDNNIAVGCGAIKKFNEQSVEVKRMYVAIDQRGKGIASLVLAELEKWAHQLGYEYCVLETGTRQSEAIALYKKNGYDIIPNYGQYAGVENSVCFQKTLRPDP